MATEHKQIGLSRDQIIRLFEEARLTRAGVPSVVVPTWAKSKKEKEMIALFESGFTALLMVIERNNSVLTEQLG